LRERVFRASRFPRTTEHSPTNDDSQIGCGDGEHEKGRATASKAARTRNRRATASKAADTRKRRRAAAKAVATRRAQAGTASPETETKGTIGEDSAEPPVL
jgi:hypothetical protein